MFLLISVLTAIYSNLIEGNSVDIESVKEVKYIEVKYIEESSLDEQLVWTIKDLLTEKIPAQEIREWAVTVLKTIK